MEVILNSIYRTVVSYILLMLLTLFWGKQINSSKNHFNFALSITLGSYIANMGFDTNLKFFPMLISFITLSVLYFIVSFISLRNRKLRKWFSGKPITLIENGKILEENFKKSRFSLDDLSQQLREKEIFNIEEIELALLEVSGNVSFLKKEKYRNLTQNSLKMNQNSEQSSMPVELIMDGKIIEENVKPPHTMEWLKCECQKQMISLHEVYYAVIGTNGQLYIDMYNDHHK